jgi:hypothetical protein
VTPDTLNFSTTARPGDGVFTHPLEAIHHREGAGVNDTWQGRGGEDLLCHKQGGVLVGA